MPKGIHFNLRPGELVGLLGPSRLRQKPPCPRLNRPFLKCPAVPNPGFSARSGRSQRLGRAGAVPALAWSSEDYALFPTISHAWAQHLFRGLRPRQTAPGPKVGWPAELLPDSGPGAIAFRTSSQEGQRHSVGPGPRALAAQGLRCCWLDEPFFQPRVECRLRLRRRLPRCAEPLRGQRW